MRLIHVLVSAIAISVGWVPNALSPQAKKICLYCKDVNAASLKVCKYCGTSLDYVNFPVPTPLAVTNETDEMPNWGPDGKIVYTSSIRGKNLWIMNADGSGKREINRGSESFADTEPYWGANGKIVFMGGTSDLNILTIDPDGANRKVVGLAGRPTDRQPSIRKDGMIVFCSDEGQWGDEWHNIFTMDSDGGNLKKLTKDGTYNSDPCWSPDGTKIVWSAIDSEDRRDIYSMNADGTNVKRLTTAPKQDYEPYWAPDGRIVFVSNRDDTTGSKNAMGEIYIMNGDGTNQRRLTWNKWTDRNPCMDAKGRLIFQADPGYGPLKSRGIWSIGMIKVK